MVTRPNRTASSVLGSLDAKEPRERSRDQKSVVSCGRGSVLGPEAWRRRERVLRNNGRREVEVCGVRVPLRRGKELEWSWCWFFYLFWGEAY